MFCFPWIPHSLYTISATMILIYNVSCRFLLCDVDIDECEVGTSNCTQICRNKDGGFSCSCEGGYEIDSDNRTCKGIVVISDQ